MKKLGLFIALFVGVLTVGCSSDEAVNMQETKEAITQKMLLDCPPGYTKKLVREFQTTRVHRGSTGCLSRFSLCDVYVWKERCVENELGTVLYPSYSFQQRSVTVVVEVLPGNQLLFRFPADMMADDEFKPEDFNTFGFDEDYEINGLRVRAGDYTPVITSTEIRITVDLVI